MHNNNKGLRSESFSRFRPLLLFVFIGAAHTFEWSHTVEAWGSLSQVIYESPNAFMSSQTGYIRVNIPEPPSGCPMWRPGWNYSELP